jgi:hypothetical protein
VLRARPGSALASGDAADPGDGRADPGLASGQRREHRVGHGRGKCGGRGLGVLRDDHALGAGELELGQWGGPSNGRAPLPRVSGQISSV